ncbi:MAG: hypothetical protein JMDDDDMK_03796 [Acidobacteria bacterium]|nr:hypothetical protein [Acidobacteriota bacterium]
MAEITTLFWDVGGVILTNGWDLNIRRRAAEHFNLDWEELQERHEQVLADFEAGRLNLADYLNRTVFYRARSFTPTEFEAFMFAQSQPHPETIAIVEALAGSGKYLVGAINNESLELNLHRIERFGLRRYFTVFFSSCFVGIRKPDVAIYRLALNVTQRSPDACLFIDDRELNLEGARLLNMLTIRYQSPAQLREELQRHGVAL